MERARDLIAAANPLGATYLLSRALVRDPQSVSALNALAEALLALGDAFSGQVAARRATTLDRDNASSHSLLGDALAALGDQQGAAASYQRSLDLRPDPAVRQRLERVSFREPPASGAHLRIQYEGGINEPLGEAVLTAVDAAYGEYVDRLGFAPHERVTVVLQTEAAFGDGKVPGWAAGVNDGNIRVPVQGLDRPTPGLVRTLRHELAHSFVALRTGDNCPTWLQEGIAQWLEGGHPDREDPRLASRAQAGTLIPLVSLEGPFRGLSEAEASLAYAESLSAIAHMLRHHGEEGIVAVISALADQLPADRALPAALGMSYQEFQESWEAHLRNVESTEG